MQFQKDDARGMTASRMAECVMDALVEADTIDDDLDVRSYEDAGVLTHDAGLVVRVGDGAEFQITVVQSRSAS